MEKKGISPAYQLLTSVLIFGTIGIFRKFIPFPSGVVACVRGLVGSLFLLALMKGKKQKLSKEEIRKNLLLLLISGGAIGLNWIFLFEAYRYTTVAAATLCYYMAPIFVILVTSLFFGERFTAKKILVILSALAGMILVSGVLGSGGISSFARQWKGILLGLAAAVLYASVVLMNTRIRQIPAFDKTIVQLGSAAVVVIPYILVCETVTAEMVSFSGCFLLLFVGIVHTGIAYALYFGSMSHLSAQTAAIMSYLDPVTAILLSALFLKERLTAASVIGAVLILGAAAVSELLPDSREQRHR